jgi:RHS repeat-associated protein
MLIYGPGELPFEQINNSSGAVLYLHHDQQGSTRLLTGSTGKTEATFTYGAYGELTGSTWTATTPLGYDAQYTSTDTGLIYLRNRVYDPATAQFLTVDPAESITRAPYNYANDNPINESDPTGRCSIWCVGGIVLGGVAVVTGVGEVVGAGALVWAASGMCRQVWLIWPSSFGHGRRCLRGCVLV